jgi:hypothetical protein
MCHTCSCYLFCTSSDNLSTRTSKLTFLFRFCKGIILSSNYTVWQASKKLFADYVSGRCQRVVIDGWWSGITLRGMRNIWCASRKYPNLVPRASRELKAAT